MWQVAREKQQKNVQNVQNTELWMTSGRARVHCDFVIAAYREDEAVRAFFDEQLSPSPPKVKEEKLAAPEARLSEFKARLRALDREVTAEEALPKKESADAKTGRSPEKGGERKGGGREESGNEGRSLRLDHRTGFAGHSVDGLAIDFFDAEGRRRQSLRRGSTALMSPTKSVSKSGARLRGRGDESGGGTVASNGDDALFISEGAERQGAVAGAGTGLARGVDGSLMPYSSPQTRSKSVRRETAASLERRAMSTARRREAKEHLQLLSECAALVPRPHKPSLAGPADASQVILTLNKSRRELGYGPVDPGSVELSLTRRALRLPPIPTSRSCPVLPTCNAR